MCAEREEGRSNWRASVALLTQVCRQPVSRRPTPAGTATTCCSYSPGLSTHARTNERCTHTHSHPRDHAPTRMKHTFTQTYSLQFFLLMHIHTATPTTTLPLLFPFMIIHTPPFTRVKNRLPTTANTTANRFPTTTDATVIDLPDNIEMKPHFSQHLILRQTTSLRSATESRKMNPIITILSLITRLKET